MAFWFLLAWFSSVACLVAGGSQYELKGHQVNLKPGITEQPKEILWKHNGNKVVEFNGNEETVFGSYENRITLNWHSAEVSISDLRFEDSGYYELELFMRGKLYSSRYTLVVIDKVAKPEISCEISGSSSDSDTFGTLDCSAESRKSQPMSFEWSSHGNVQRGPQLTISLGDRHDDEVYSCNVSNPLSYEIATFTAKDCYSGEGSSVTLIASVVTISIILIVSLLGVLYCKKSHKEINSSFRTPNTCFVKDVEKPWPPVGTRGTESAPAEDDRTVSRAPTRRCTRPLVGYHPEREMDVQDETPQKGCDMAAQDEMPKKGFVREKRDRFEPNHHGQTIAHDKDSQNGTTPKGCDMAAQDEMPKKGFVREKRDRFEPNHHGQTIDSSKGTTQDDENSPLLPKDHKTDTPQPQGHQECLNTVKVHGKDPQNDTTLKEDDQNKDEHEKTISRPCTPRSESSSPDHGDLVSDNEADADADQLTEAAEEEIPQSSNEPEPAEVSGNLCEELMCHRESATAPEKPGEEQNKDKHENTASPPYAPPNESPSPLREAAEKEIPQSSKAPEPAGASSNEADEDEEAKSPSAKGVSPPALPPVVPEDTASEHKEDANLDQVNGETARTFKSVSATENDSHSIGDSEAMDQDPPPTLPDSVRNSTQELPDTSHDDPDKE